MSNEIPAICKKRNRELCFQGILKSTIVAAFGLFPGMGMVMLYENKQELWIGIGFMVVGFIAFLVLLNRIISLFFPVKGKLGKSILSQQDYLEEINDIESLFHEVDEDIALNGRKFDRVTVGKKWILGDEAMIIDRIRGVFSIETKKYQYGKAYELWLVDDRRNFQTTRMTFPNELEAVYIYLKALVPDVTFGSMDDYFSFITKDEQEMEKYNRTIKERRYQEKINFQVELLQEFSYLNKDGKLTSIATWSDIQKEIRTMKEQEKIRLMPVQPIDGGGYGKNLGILCTKTENGYEILTVFAKNGDVNRFCIQTDRMKAEDLFQDYFKEKKIPDIFEWQRCEADNNPQEQRYAKLILFVDKNRFLHTTFDDVYFAFEGIYSGQYKSMGVMYEEGILGGVYVEMARQEKFSVEAVINGEQGSSRWKTETTNKDQVLKWLYDYCVNAVVPDTSKWKSI